MNEITFKPSVKQFAAWEFLTDSITTEIGYGGAAYGGKSYLGCFWQLARRIAYPETMGLIGRKELLNLKRTTLLTFFKVCEDYKIIPEKHFTLNNQSNTITFTNGSIIFLLDLSNQPSDPLYTRLGGLELTDAFVDESNEVPLKAIEILKTRIGRKNNEKYTLLPKLLETFNPDKGHVYRRYYKPWRENTLSPHIRFIKALPTDNPHATKDYINQLLHADKVTKERLYYGNFEYDDDPSRLMEFDAIVDLFTNPPQFSDNLYLSCDVARFGEDKTVIHLWRGLELYRTDVYEKKGIDEISNIIRNTAWQEKIPFSHIIVDEDGIGGGVKDVLRGVKGFIANSSPLEEQGMKVNYANLKTQCSYILARLVNERKITVRAEENVKDKIIEDLEQIKGKDIDKDGKLKLVPKEEVKERLGRSPDYGDAMVMRMYFELLPVRRYAQSFIPQLRELR